jgi:hypothetical protein
MSMEGGASPTSSALSGEGATGSTSVLGQAGGQGQMCCYTTGSGTEPVVEAANFGQEAAAPRWWGVRAGAPAGEGRHPLSQGGDIRT